MKRREETINFLRLKLPLLCWHVENRSVSPNCQASTKEIRLDLHGVGQNIANLLSFTYALENLRTRSFENGTLDFLRSLSIPFAFS